MEETLRTYNRVLSCAGITVFTKDNWNTKKWFTTQLFNVSIGIISFTFSSGYMINNISNIFFLIQGACVWTTTVMMNITLIVCFLYRTKFRIFLEDFIFIDCALSIPVIENVLQLEPKHGILKTLKDTVTDSQENLYRFSRILIKCYLVICIVCITLFNSGPVYSMYISEDKSLRLLAFDIWFPWSLRNFNTYIGSFMLSAYAGYLCCFLFSGFQCMIALIFGQIIRQLKILTFILYHLNKIAEELVDERGDKWQEECTLILIQCFKHYTKIKRYSKEINLICQPFYVVALLDCTLLVCVVSVKINLTDKFSMEIIKYYIQELLFVIYIFLFCYLGQQIENKSEKLEEVVTEKWYIYSRKHKINVQIFKTALSQGMPIYIFGSVTLSLATFTWFIKTGMSFFTIMMSVLEN